MTVPHFLIKITSKAKTGHSKMLKPVTVKLLWPEKRKVIRIPAYIVRSYVRTLLYDWRWLRVL